MKFLELEGVRFNREPGDEANEVTEVIHIGGDTYYADESGDLTDAYDAGSGNLTPGDSIPVAES